MTRTLWVVLCFCAVINADFGHPHENYKEWEHQPIPVDLSMISVTIDASGGEMKGQVIVPKHVVDDVLTKSLNKHLWKEWNNDKIWYAATHNWEASLTSNGIELKTRFCVGANVLTWYHQSFDLKTRIELSDLKISNGELSVSISFEEIKLQNFDNKLGQAIGFALNQIQPAIRNIVSSQVSKSVQEIGTQIVQSHSLLKSLHATALNDYAVALEIRDEQVIVKISSVIANIKIEL